MSEELGIKHSFFGWSQTARLLGFSASSWFIGRILDRYGARFLMAIAGMFLGLSMVALSLIQEGWQLVAIFFFIGVIGMQGGGANLYQAVPLSRWFVRHRGKAMSLSLVGVPVGIFIFSPLTQFIIDSLNWRSAWLILGGGGSMVIMLVGLLVIGKDPQSMGLQPDGDLSLDEGAESSSKIQRPVEYSWTQPQATSTFRLLGTDRSDGT